MPRRGGEIDESERRIAYVAISFGGVQSFIAAARRTSDLWAASRILSHLSATAALAARGQLVLPASGDANDGDQGDEEGAAQDQLALPASEAPKRSFPNRILVEVDAGRAADAAKDAVAAVAKEWRALSAKTHGHAASAHDPVLATFPDLRWVTWEPSQSATPDLVAAWTTITAAATARKRVRAFAPHPGAGGQVCSLCGRFGNVTPPERIRSRLRRGEQLCAICLVKVDADAVTAWLGEPERKRFPSTASIAVTPFRACVLETIQATHSPELLAAVNAHLAAIDNVYSTLKAMGFSAPPTPGDGVGAWAEREGAWCYADTWSAESILHESGSDETNVASLESACIEGRRAATGLVNALVQANPDAPAPATYLAVLVQDGDDVGDRLDKGVAAAADPRAWLRDVSVGLANAAAEQTAAVLKGSGQPVYSGGDDMVALVPLASALNVADDCRKAYGNEARAFAAQASASSMLVCFHHSFPLQEAVARAQSALKQLKHDNPGKDRLGVIVLRRGGERARTSLLWQRSARSAARTLAGLARAFRGDLSPKLMADMTAERHGLVELSRDMGAHRSELERLLERHHGTAALDLVMGVEPIGGIRAPSDVDAWVDALQVARFFAAEAR